jgi:manganese/zinc/iron transport system substrate-binding protein
VFYNGLHLEGKMAEVLAEVGQRGVTTAAVAACIADDRLISATDFAAVHDPHVWFDVALWTQAADCAAAVLQGVDPEHAEDYAARASAYRQELAALDHWVRARVEEIPEASRVLVTAHDAFAYFGRAYGLEVRGLLGVSTAAEVGTADVQELAELIATRRIPAIFVETSVSPRYVQALQEAVQARGFDVAIGGSLYSDALGDPGSSAATYIGTVRANVDTVVGALTAEADSDG